MQESAGQWTLRGLCPVRTACDAQQLRAGSVPMAQLPRLVAWLPDDRSEVMLAYELRFFRDESRALLASVRIEGVAQLPCARCLAPMTVPLAGQSVVQFVFSEAQAERVPDEYEPVMLDADGQVSLIELIEEEAIMALPSVVMHEPRCAPAWQESVGPAVESSASTRENPFAVLADRLGSGKAG